MLGVCRLEGCGSFEGRESVLQSPRSLKRGSESRNVLGFVFDLDRAGSPLDSLIRLPRAKANLAHQMQGSRVVGVDGQSMLAAIGGLGHQVGEKEALAQFAQRCGRSR